MYIYTYIIYVNIYIYVYIYINIHMSSSVLKTASLSNSLVLAVRCEKSRF